MIVSARALCVSVGVCVCVGGGGGCLCVCVCMREGACSSVVLEGGWGQEGGRTGRGVNDVRVYAHTLKSCHSSISRTKVTYQVFRDRTPPTLFYFGGGGWVGGGL